MYRKYRKLLVLSAAALAVVMHQLPANATFEALASEQVPIERLLKNLDAKAKGEISHVDRATLEFQIGRLHSMAYAEKTEAASVIKHIPGSSIQPYTLSGSYGRSKFKQFRVRNAEGQEQESSAKQHLQEALNHLNRAVELDPTLLEARMGLAWCLLQAREKEKALPLFREVFAQAWEREGRGIAMLPSITAEVGTYLSEILDKNKDEAELADIATKTAVVKKSVRGMTPILVPLCPDVSSDEVIRPQKVVFDLEGTGLRQCSQWTGDKAGWLVYDSSGKKRITSGLQLFGRRTFWIFWKNGYQALSALDDNQNGRIEGAELNCLAVWQDRNGNGESEAAEVLTLDALDIESLSCEYVPLENGILRSTNGVRFRSGKTADTYDWILQTEAY